MTVEILKQKKTRWPFMFVTDKDGIRTQWVVLHAPIQSQSRMDMYSEYRQQGLRFIGMTSFMTFPADQNTASLDYHSICEAWAHCFREPSNYLPENRPQVLLPFSDFIDPLSISRHQFQQTSTKSEAYDFLYLGSNEPWKMKAKNWELALKCLPLLCNELGLRGAVVGIDPQMLPECDGLTIKPWLSYQQFLQLLSNCRFLFAPNSLDASPRVLAEALCLDVPIIANRSLIGGWHYINRHSGMFFHDEHDICTTAQHCLNSQFQPRAFFINQFGPQRSGKTLLSLIQQLEPDICAKGPLRLSY